MPIAFTCPHCGHETQAGDRFGGQTGPCASCGAQVTIPHSTSELFPPSPLMISDSKRKKRATARFTVTVVTITVVALGLLVALVLPAVQAARNRARRMHCKNNLKLIGLGMHNYHDAHKTFPPAFIPDQAGVPQHSWRVAILPFMDTSTLYGRYDFNRPWNAPENQFAVDTPFAFFRCAFDPTSQAAPTDTNYLLVTGPGTIFEVGRKANIARITDGTSRTVLAVEVQDCGINWSEPRDLHIEAFVAMFGRRGTVQGQGCNWQLGGTNVLLADGSVRFVPFDLSKEQARAMATCAGSERIDFWD